LEFRNIKSAVKTVELLIQEAIGILFVLSALQIFWLIPPTKENYELYEEWALAGNKDIFFADEVKSCQRIVVEPGHLLFIPAGCVCLSRLIRRRIVGFRRLGNTPKLGKTC